MDSSTIDRVVRFRDDRNWRQFHNLKDLALSISLEAAELLEIFQWSGGDLRVEHKSARLKDELADVLMYCILLADAAGLDLDEIVLEKLKKNEEKYPAGKVAGKSDKYTAYEDKTP